MKSHLPPTKQVPMRTHAMLFVAKSQGGGPAGLLETGALDVFPIVVGMCCT